MHYSIDRSRLPAIALWLCAYAVMLVLPSLVVAADEKERQEVQWKQPAWGKIVSGDSPGRYVFSYDALPKSGKLRVPHGFPQIAAIGNDAGPFGRVHFNKDASQIDVVAPEGDSGAQSIPVIVAETTGQYADGTIVFAAREARVHGEQAKLEVHPANYRIGFWRNTEEFVAWDYNATRWGMYRVLLTYATPWPDGAEIEIAMGDAKVPGKLKKTGSSYHYTTIDFGNIYLAKSGKQTLSVRCLKKTGKSIMNLKTVTLIPACEGKPPTQQADASVTLHGRDAVVHGTSLRYEPAEKKQTLGFWRNASDKAGWTFDITQPGEFDVEVLQGCGKGQGGSRVMVTVACEGDKAQVNTFVVEDTGHFQAFRPRHIGKVRLASGKCRLYVQPIEIKARSCCDIRQIRLTPVAAEEKKARH